MGCVSSSISHRTSSQQLLPSSQEPTTTSITNTHTNEEATTEEEESGLFIYTGQPRAKIPWHVWQNVTHIKVHPSVKVIRARAFEDCIRLINIELNEGLERIEDQAFKRCKSNIFCRWRTSNANRALQNIRRID